ncbi:MAG: hypothetical protein ACHQNT_11275 [Bacteroidia bacterium]
MEINKSNYEIYFLDFYEGNLSAEMQAELFLFLEQHPELKSEFKNFDLVKLPESDIRFPDKSILKKEIVTEENIQQYLVAKLEGDLNKEELHELNKFLFSHPQFKKDEKLFELTRLSPDKNIVFENKSLLKKAIPIAESKKRVYYISVAVAACIVLLIGFYFLNKDAGTQIIQANNETKKETAPVQKNKAGIETINTAKQNETQEALNKVDVVQKPIKRETVKQIQHELLATNNKVDTSGSNPSVEKNIPEEIFEMPVSENRQPEMKFVDPALMKQKLAEQIEKNPSQYNSKEFEAFLDKVSNPDSSFTDEDLNKPVFSSSTLPAEAAKPAVKENTPVLNALAWGLSKVSNNDVTLKKNYNNDGELVAYRFESGNLKFGKADDK